MSGWGWGLLGIIYLVLLFTLGIMTFRKGHWVLGIICLVHAFFRIAQPAPGSDLAVRAGGLFS